MTRWAGRFVALAIMAILAVGAGFGASAAQGADGAVSVAAENDVSLVPRAKLKERPWRGITLITVGNRVACTGFVVGPRKVVTAAHCLTRNAADGDYRFRQNLPGNVRVYRAFSQKAGGTTYKTCDVAKVWAHSKFIKSGKKDKVFGSRAHDYAVLTTKDGCTYPSNAFMRMWANEVGDGKLAVDKKVRLGGYPADPRESGMNGLSLYRTEGRVKANGTDPRLLVTSGFVAQGMSGAPVWRSFSKDSPCGRTQCVVGILTECEINAKGLCKRGDSERLSVRLTPIVKAAIKRH